MREKPMRRNTLLLRVFFLLTLLACTRARAQDTILRQTFAETTDPELPYHPDIAPYGTGGLPTWNVVERIKGIETAATGGHFWAARDVDNSQSGSPVSRLSFPAGTICHLTKARFVLAYRVVGYDGGDDLGYELYQDGFIAESGILVDGRNGGGVSTGGWVYDTIAISGSAETARLVVYFDQNGDDVAAIDDVQLLASGTNGSCTPKCGIRLETPLADCDGFTAAADRLTVRIPYRGAEREARTTVVGATVGGDDPATVADGIIEVSGLVEGGDYALTIDGGDCALELELSYPRDQCRPSSLVINEVLAAPGEDINGDGSVTPADEFVEILHTGQEPTDVSGYTLHDASNSGARFTFPEATILQPGESFVIYAGMGSGGGIDAACNHDMSRGFLGLNDDTPETVSLRDPSGRVVARAAFSDAPDGESLVLSPDGNLAGGYHPHTQVVPGETSSPCVQAIALPVTLTQFTATAAVRSIRLDWQTEEERDNEKFVVERSKAGVDYTVVGEVPAGSGIYAFVDEQPLPGWNVYRLRQVDFDGRETVFGPVSARIDSGQVDMYPNPTAGRLYLTGDIDPSDRLAVYRADGQRVAVGRGSEINVSAIPAGVYYLRLRRGSDVSSWRFIKE
jgi:hypothetical protein